jgi:hypothetical protein
MRANPPTTPHPTVGTLALHLHAPQFEVFHCQKRFRVLVAGRRFGKSELALAELLRAAKDAPNRLVWYVAPSQKFAKRTIWPRLKKITRNLWASTPREQGLHIDLINGSSISVQGGFNPDNLRGDGLDFVVLDETSDIKPDVWAQSLYPALTDRKGRALFLGTPKGRNHLYDYFELAQSNPAEWASYQFTTEQGGIVEKSELESVSRSTDANTFSQEFEARFTTLGQYLAYLSFTRESNVCDTHFELSAPLIWSLDFNVDPMCMLLMQRIRDTVYVLHEIAVRSNNNTTEEACRIFVQHAEPYLKAVSRTYGVLNVQIYGDASGHQRRTSAASTDWSLIRQYFATHHRGEIQINCHFANANPYVRDRVNCVNARLRNALGEPQLFISPGAKELIRDLEEVCYAVDSTGSPTTELNKSDRHRTHMSDALGYYLSQAFPLRAKLQLPIP